MKTGIRKIGMLIVAIGLLSNGAAFAQSGAKGGGLKLLEISGKRTDTPASFVQPQAPLCVPCKFESKVISERENKARVVRPLVLGNHACADCKTRSLLVGHGKSKVEKQSHICAISAENTRCCAR